SYLYKLKGDLQMAIHYVNLASQKYNEKINKKIFKKIEKFKINLLKLENIQTNELIFLNKNQMNLLQIFNLIRKFHFESISYLTLGFDLFKETSSNALLNCLFYHLIEEDDIEDYLKNHTNNLTQKYHNFQNQRINEKEFMKSFNMKFGTNFKCFHINETVNWNEFILKNNEIPIILMKDLF
ncbi:unnamed protein product, partial [Didymodactylos carnosus]